jgi:predicted lipoprotein
MSGCKSDSTPAGVDRAQLLDDLTANVVLPTYRDFSANADELATKVDALCDAPDAARLDDARSAWRAARIPYKRSEAFALGPVVDLRIDAAVDFWPVRTGDVDEVLAGADPIDAASLGATRKGLGVMGYLLFDPEGDVLPLLEEGGVATRRCDYARALATDVAAKATELVTAWEPSGGDYGAELLADPKDGLTEVVNALLTHTQNTEGNRIGKPSGRQDGGTPQPDAVESPWSRTSLDDIKSCIDGIESVYLGSYEGAKGVSIADDVTRRSPELDPLIRQQIVELRTRVDAIPAPLAVAVTEDPESVEAAFLAAKELLRLLAADMSTALGTTPTFSDNDGD